MKIAYLITELHEGGAEHALGQIACRAAQRGHQVAVACCYGHDGAVADRLRQAGIPVACLQIHGFHHLWRARRLRRWLCHQQPDILHSWLFRANLLARFQCPPTLPLVCGLRVVEQRTYQIALDRWTQHRVQRYACVSSAVKDFAVNQLGVSPERCAVIENGVDFQAFAPARQRQRPADPLCGLTVARLSQQKGLDIFLHGLSGLPADLDWQWTFVGAAPEPHYQQHLLQLANQLHIADRLHWIGPVTRDDIIHHYAAANLFALPSRWEGQPNVVLEAMAAGLPVISSRTDGIDDILRQHPDSLHVVDPNEPGSWTTALHAIWQDAPTRAALATAGLAAATVRSWDDVTSAYLALYQDMTRQPKD